MSKPAVEAHGLRKAFSQVQALDGLSLAVPTAVKVTSSTCFRYLRHAERGNSSYPAGQSRPHERISHAAAGTSRARDAADPAPVRDLPQPAPASPVAGRRCPAEAA